MVDQGQICLQMRSKDVLLIFKFVPFIILGNISVDEELGNLNNNSNNNSSSHL